MSLKEPNVEEEGRRGPAVEERDSRGRHMACARVLVRKDDVIADGAWFFGDVLQSSQHRGVAGRFKGV